jgi:hypothetical protein
MSRNIIFRDEFKNELFIIPDDTCIELIHSDGRKEVYPCRYVTKHETNIGGCIYEDGFFAYDHSKEGALFAPCDVDPEKIGVYEIYQIEDVKNVSYSFLSYNEAADELKKDDYKLVYTGMHAKDTSLDDLYSKHNQDDRPFPRKMRSVSISDVIVLKRDGEISAWYVDRFGFKRIQNF